MSLVIPELLSQKAGQVHVDAGKGDTGVHIRMYTYTVGRKRLQVLAWEVGWCMYFVQGLVILVSKERLEKLTLGIVAQLFFEKTFFPHHPII